MNEDWVVNIIQRLLEGVRYPIVLIQPEEFLHLCDEAKTVFNSQSCLLYLNAPIVICGDIWGQYGDLLRLFHSLGFPPKTSYLFLGNYTFNDRFETLCLLLAYKIKYPNNIFLLRGECTEFEVEVKKSLSDLFFYCEMVCGTEALLNSLTNCFNCMPVAAIVDKKVFCVHGGLSPHLHKLKQISGIERPATLKHNNLLRDLLTSKPDSEIRGWSYTKGNISFGPDVVSQFLKKFNLDLICRGQERVESGFKFFADRQLVTIFSAPSFEFRQEPTLKRHGQKAQDCNKNLNKVGVVMAIDDNFVCTFRFMRSNDPKFYIEFQQQLDCHNGRVPNRILKTIQELPEVKSTKVLPIDNIGRKEKFKAAFMIEELAHNSNTIYKLKCMELLEKNMEWPSKACKADDARNLNDNSGLANQGASQQERNVALKEKPLQLKIQQSTNNSLRSISSNVCYEDLQEATKNFNISMKIGEGGFAIVYKGLLRGTTVAIKTLRPERLIEQSGFEQEAIVLSGVRHPNLVTLIGYCLHPFALVYEYLSKGSLEDRLACKGNSPPLSWQVRTRIIAEIRSALIFLHTNKPHPIVHGDLKPDNIFLDANMVSKLGDFGICSFLDSTSTTNNFYHFTDHPKGTFGYIDPEYLTTGRLTTQSDVFSFGVIILRLVIGKPAIGIIEVAQKVITKWNFPSITDPSAGNWPAAQAKELIKLGLKCCQLDRKKRPTLDGKVWRVVEAPLLSTP